MSICHYTLLSLLLLNSHLFAGFSADTLVKTEQSYKEIEQADSGNTVACMKADGTSVLNRITHKYAHLVQSYVTITLDDDVIVATLDQKFFLPIGCGIS
jgi:hypothetical protein